MGVGTLRTAQGVPEDLSMPIHLSAMAFLKPASAIAGGRAACGASESMKMQEQTRMFSTPPGCCWTHLDFIHWLAILLDGVEKGVFSCSAMVEIALSLLGEHPPGSVDILCVGRCWLCVHSHTRICIKTPNNTFMVIMLEDCRDLSTPTSML